MKVRIHIKIKLILDYRINPQEEFKTIIKFYKKTTYIENKELILKTSQPLEHLKILTNSKISRKPRIKLHKRTIKIRGFKCNIFIELKLYKCCSKVLLEKLNLSLPRMIIKFSLIKLISKLKQ